MSLSSRLLASYQGATEGPWDVRDVGGKVGRITAGDRLIAAAPGREDAPLIAAAPTLLQLLAEAVENIESHHEDDVRELWPWLARVRVLVEAQEEK